MKHHKFFFAHEILEQQIPNISKQELQEVIDSFYPYQEHELVDIACVLEDKGFLEDFPIIGAIIKKLVDYLGTDDNGSCYVCY